MENKLSKIKYRVLYVSDILGVKREEFFSSIGQTYGNYKGENKETGSVSSEVLEKIVTIYPQISSEWLLTGRGPALKENTEKGNSVFISTGSNFSNRGDVIHGGKTINSEASDNPYLELTIEILRDQISQKDKTIAQLMEVVSKLSSSHTQQEQRQKQHNKSTS